MNCQFTFSPSSLGTPAFSFHHFFPHGGADFLFNVFVKSGATESIVDCSLLLKLSTITLQGAGKISAGVLCKIPMKFAATSEIRLHGQFIAVAYHWESLSAKGIESGSVKTKILTDVDNGDLIQNILRLICLVR